jgi:hypothetical protein
MIETSFPRAALNDSLENVYYDKKKKGGGEGPLALDLSWFVSKALGRHSAK